MHLDSMHLHIELVFIGTEWDGVCVRREGGRCSFIDGWMVV